MIKNHKRNNIICIGIFTAVLFALFLFALMLFEPKVQKIPLTVKVTSGEITEEIKPWYDDKGIWYFFLPSYTDFDSSILCTHERKCFLGGVQLNSDQKLDFIELEREYSFEQHSFWNEESSKIVFMKSANVAAMYIDTKSGNMDAIYANKDYKEQVSVKILNETGKIDYVSNYTDKLNLRGNSTRSLEKKPFKLTLSVNTSLLGMKEAKNWILLSNGYDETNLRNKLIYDFASKVNMGWTPHSEYVDLYLNGEYNGLYLFSEKVEVADNRVILNDLDNDYLFEALQEGKLQRKDFNFHKSDKNYFRVDYPRECSESKLAAIQQDVYRLNEEINAGDLSEIDLDSWAKRFLIDEVFINFDAIIASSFYHYNTASGKFFAGPIWDFDLSFGSDASPWTSKSKMPRQIWGVRKYWYDQLYQNDIFYKKVKQVYREEFLPKLEKMLEYDLPYQSGKIYNASVCNSIRWDEMFKASYPSGDKELGERIDELSLFLQERLSYLASIWLSDKEFEIVRWYKADKTTLLDVTQVEHGTAIIDFPTQNGETVYNWYEVNNDNAFDVTQPVTKSIDLFSDSFDVQSEVPSDEMNRNAYLYERLTTQVLPSMLCIIIGCSLVLFTRTDVKRSGKGGGHGKRKIPS